MAAITWKNIAPPSFAASNALRLAGAEQISDAFSNFGTTLSDRYERVGERNTGELEAQMAGIEGLDNFAAKRQAIMDDWQGKNVDLGAGVEAGNAKRTLLQGNKTFANAQNIFDYKTGPLRDRATTEFELSEKIKKFEVDNLQDSYNVKRSNLVAETNKNILANKATQYANSSEGKLAAKNTAALEQTNKEILAKIKAGTKKNKDGFFSSIEKGTTGDPYKGKYALTNEHTDYRNYLKKLDLKGKDGQSGWFKGSDGKDRKASTTMVEAALQQYRANEGWDAFNPNFNEGEVNKILTRLVDEAPLVINSDEVDADIADKNAAEVAAYIKERSSKGNRDNRATRRKAIRDGLNKPLAAPNIGITEKPISFGEFGRF